MKALKYLLLLPVAVLAFFTEELSSYLVDSRLSWALSKWWIYIILWLTPIIYLIRIRKQTMKAFTLSLTCFLFSTTMAAYHFYIYPVYEGDVSNRGVIMEGQKVLDNFEEGLLMISIPGCPYCFEATESLKILKQRNPGLAIRQIVLTNRKEDLELYNISSNGHYKVDSSTAYSFYGEITASYPTFVLVKDGLLVKKWDNSAFGVLAKDEVESYF